jgi:FkbM family methyltransferase
MNLGRVSDLLRRRRGNARRQQDPAVARAIERAVESGRQLLEAGRLPEAVRSFREAIRLDGANGDAWRGIGRITADAGLAEALLDGLLESTTEWTHAKSAGQPLLEPEARYAHRRGLPLGDAILAHGMADESFVLLDGGAREAEADARWSRLDPARLTTYGFEPDEQECERLNAIARQNGARRIYYPVGLWSVDGTLPFHENHVGGGSSFMEQNPTVSDRWKFENPTQTALAREIFRPKRTYDVKVVTLASWAQQHGVAAIDFVKLNVQGGELEILRKAGPVLESVHGLLLEASFCESYRGRPFFSDVDVFLRARGFVFFDLLAHHYIGRAASPIAQQHLRSVRPRLGQLVSAWGQLIEGHALYLRDPIAEAPDGPTDGAAARRALKLACVAEIYGQIEYAFELAAWVSRADGHQELHAWIESAAETYRRFY